MLIFVLRGRRDGQVRHKVCMLGQNLGGDDIWRGTATAPKESAICVEQPRLTMSSLDMVPPCESRSRRWKSLSTPDTPALSAARTR